MELIELGTLDNFHKSTNISLHLLSHTFQIPAITRKLHQDLQEFKIFYFLVPEITDHQVKLIKVFKSFALYVTRISRYHFEAEDQKVILVFHQLAESDVKAKDHLGILLSDKLGYKWLLSRGGFKKKPRDSTRTQSLGSPRLRTRGTRVISISR
jgi:hypothetical protein